MRLNAYYTARLSVSGPLPTPVGKSPYAPRVGAPYFPLCGAALSADPILSLARVSRSIPSLGGGSQVNSLGPPGPARVLLEWFRGVSPRSVRSARRGETLVSVIQITGRPPPGAAWVPLCGTAAPFEIDPSPQNHGSPEYDSLLQEGEIDPPWGRLLLDRAIAQSTRPVLKHLNRSQLADQPPPTQPGWLVTFCPRLASPCSLAFFPLLPMQLSPVFVDNSKTLRARFRIFRSRHTRDPENWRRPLPWRRAAHTP